MSKTAFKLDQRRALADGTYPVKIKVGYGTNIYLSTGVYLTPAEWDQRTQLCVGKQARPINAVLTVILTRITNRLLELRASGRFEAYNRAQLRQMLTDLSLDAPTVGAVGIYDYIDKYRARVEGRTASTYDNIKAKLKKYYPDDVPLTALNALWWEDLQRTLRADGLKVNTIAQYIRALKTVIRYAERSGEAVDAAYRFVSPKKEETAMRNLPVEGLRRIRDAELEGFKMLYRDAFMLSFYLIGINGADLLALKKSDVVNGRITYRRAKTNRLYSIKIEPEAAEILARYATPGKDPRLLSFGGRNVASFNRLVARYLDEIVNGVTWYYARYSWANYAIDLDVPKDVVSEALGHSHGAAVTGIYVKYSLDKIDEANRQVLDYFAGKK